MRCAYTEKTCETCLFNGGCDIYRAYKEIVEPMTEMVENILEEKEKCSSSSESENTE